MGSSSPSRDENKKYLKPPPSSLWLNKQRLGGQKSPPCWPREWMKDRGSNLRNEPVTRLGGICSILWILYGLLLMVVGICLVPSEKIVFNLAFSIMIFSLTPKLLFQVLLPRPLRCWFLLSVSNLQQNNILFIDQLKHAQPGMLILLTQAM